jgi:hypothetical protein
MKTKSILVLLALTIVLPFTSDAQPAFIKNKINNAINKKIETDIDSSIERNSREAKAKKQKEENSQNNSDKTSSQDNSGDQGSARGLFGGKIDIKYSDEYSFTGRIYMQMETYDKKDVMKSDYFTYFNSNNMNASIEVKVQNAKDGDKTLPTVFLFDNDNRCFMMLLESGDSKTGIISTIPSDSDLAAQTKTQSTGSTTQPTITKTGNSRTIAGYKCDEYKITEPGKDGYSTVWMTKDVKIKADKRYWGKTGMPTYYNYPGFEGAMMLAMEAYDKNNQPAMKMETKEISEKFNHSISTAGYTFMKMNFGQAGKK